MYCSPNYTYHPWGLPRSVGLLTLSPNLTHEQLTWIPVLHTKDHHPIRFYYYAQGCSDLYLSPRKPLLALNRIDALFRLMPRVAYRELKHRCKTTEPLNRIVQWLRTPHAASNPGVPRSFATLSGNGCLNDIVYQNLELQGYDVLVLNHEFSGEGLHQKVEIMQVHDGVLFDKNGSACFYNRSMPCLHCGDRTPLTRRTCERAAARAQGASTV